MAKRSIAVVDDEPEFRAFVGSVARACGFEPFGTGSAAAFEDFVATRHPDVAMLELAMGESDGIEVMCRLAARPTTVPLIIASRIDDRMLQTARRLGEARGLHIAGAFRKPVRVQELQALLECLGDGGTALTGPMLAAAIMRDELELHYEPCMDLRTRRIVGVEALARWRHARHGLIMPSAFIGLAEENALIDALTEAVFVKALAQLARWRHDGLDLRCAVNVSARSLGNAELLERIFALRRERGVDPAQLTVELTESATAEDPERMSATLERFREQGFAVAIDDFGTGFSSLARLRQLPFSELKLDRSFIGAMPRSRACRVIVRSTIDMAHELGLRVVAEGVEDVQLLEQLTATDCDFCQGHGISRPIEAAHVAAFVEAHHAR